MSGSKIPRGSHDADSQHDTVRAGSSGANAAVDDSGAASADRVLKAAAAARTTLGTRISRPFHIRQLMKSGVLTGQPVHCVSADGSTLTGVLTLSAGGYWPVAATTPLALIESVEHRCNHHIGSQCV